MRGTRGATRSRGQRLLYPPPSLDLRFAETRSLTDAISGQNLITFTRASSGTYVGSDGVLKTATTNLLLRSEELATSPWFNANVTISNNSTDVIDPLGGTKSTKIVATGSGSAVGQGAVISSVSTGSIWLRTSSGTASFGLIIYLSSSPFTNIGTANITVTTTWQRFSITSSAPASSASYNFQLQAIPATTLYAFGAQLEQSSTVGEYIPTTSTINSAPRFDHNPTTGESLGLLVEESRTNLLLRSGDLNDSSWEKYDATIASNVVLAPDGTLTGDKLAENTNTSTHIAFQGSASLSAGATVCASIFLKAGERTFASLGTPSGGVGTGINLLTGELVNVSVPGWVNATTRGAVPVGNGWYRVYFVFTTTGNNSVFDALRVFTNNGSTTFYAGDGTSGIYIWGAQLEAGAFPTSYIPTTTATVTRSADVASITGTNFSSWYRQDEGTVFADLITSSRGHGAYPRLVAILGSNVNNGNEASIYTRNISSSEDYRLFGTYWDGVGSTADFNPGSGAPLGSGKVAMAIKNNDGGYSVNRATLLSDTTCSVPTPIQLRLFGEARFQPSSSGYIRRLTYWPQRLPNNTLIALTR